MYSLDPIIFVVSKKKLLFISILLRTKSCIDGHLGFLISLKNRSFFKVPSIDNTCTVRVQSCLLFLRKCFNHFSIGFCVKNYCGGHLGSGEIKTCLEMIAFLINDNLFPDDKCFYKVY